MNYDRACLCRIAVTWQSRRWAVTVMSRTAAKVNAIQWKKVKFDPPTVPETLKPMATKFGMDHEVGNPYPCAKFYHYPIRGFRSQPRPLPYRSCAYKVTRLVNFFGKRRGFLYSQGPCTDFYNQNVKWRRFEQEFAFGVSKTTFYISTTFSTKKRKFLANFDQKISQQ